jgi:hypothetical protein
MVGGPLVGRSVATGLLTGAVVGHAVRPRRVRADRRGPGWPASGPGRRRCGGGS